MKDPNHTLRYLLALVKVFHSQMVFSARQHICYSAPYAIVPSV